MNGSGSSSRSALGQRNYEDFNPSFKWFQDEGRNQTLVVDLPGFEKENLRVQLDIYGNIMISGERQVMGARWSRFRKNFRVSEDSDTGQIRAKFEDGHLYVMIPKLVTTKTEPPVKQQEAPPSQKAAAAAVGQNVNDRKDDESKIQEKKKEKKEDDGYVPSNKMKEGKEGGSAHTGQRPPAAVAAVDQKPRTNAKVTETANARKDDEPKMQEKERTEDDVRETGALKNLRDEDEPGRNGLSSSTDPNRQLVVNILVAMLILLGIVIYATYRLGVSHQLKEGHRSNWPI